MKNELNLSPSPDNHQPFLSLPATAAGRWSIRFLTIGVLFFVLFQLLVLSGQRGGDTFFDNLWLAIAILPAGLGFLSGGAAAAVAVIRRRERSFLAFIALLIGLLVLIFISGEFISPH